MITRPATPFIRPKTMELMLSIGWCDPRALSLHYDRVLRYCRVPEEPALSTLRTATRLPVDKEEELVRVLRELPRRIRTRAEATGCAPTPCVLEILVRQSSPRTVALPPSRNVSRADEGTDTSEEPDIDQ